MNIVAFDLEMTTKRSRKGFPEIIELGAAKVDIDNLKIIDTFAAYIKPKESRLFEELATKLTGITWDQLEHARDFKQVFGDFLSWLGNDYFLCAWSENDLPVLIYHATLHNFSLHWLQNYNNVQPAISRAIGAQSKLGLAHAVTLAGIEKVGEFHSAGGDAYNTLNLIIKYYPVINLKKNRPEDNYTSYCSYSKKCKRCKELVSKALFKKGKSVCNNCVKGELVSEPTNALSDSS